MSPDEIERLRKLSAHMEEDVEPDENLLTTENIHNIFILATSVSKLLAHIDAQYITDLYKSYKDIICLMLALVDRLLPFRYRFYYNSRRILFAWKN